ncbi:MAG: leucine-rich repeat protein [Clostridia bacterium]|jgi:uncharacterized protein YozE (UPF0346 family)|nr:leucine-rich repeat protein [Clostridia bacterium]
MANNLNTIKCPNCAAAIDISTAVGGVIKCKYCKQPIVLPKTTDNAACVALETANNFLNLCDFDRAYETYRSIADKFPDEPEAYFGMALAANKVRYINDIKNNCLQPICYNATNKSFSSDANYIKALSLATVEQKNEYMRRANEIDYIRNEFYKLKQSGKAYDCFICVKVSGEGGHKTIDSERANDIYYHLKDKGYRPFYSEREIQNETGADYEARILYALFSSPCMLVVCSDESYLQTPWVKNEYSRFISLINDEQKETNSIAIGFFDTPIERLPGRNGRLQGVCLKNPDAYSKIVDFVDKHYNLNAEAPQISRKTYSQVAYQKKSVVKSQIQKRTLAKFEQTAITVSEQSKLDIAKSMLDSGNFNAVISRCNSILETNKSCALAYWYLFLAENECKTGGEFEKSTKRINSFDSIESAIATGDNYLKNECYAMLFNRAMMDRQLYIYDEYISLPDSSTDKIKQLTAAMHTDLIYGVICNDAYSVFEAILKTVDDADIFVDMNLSFADKVFDYNKDFALKCYKSVIDIEASNGHALWQLFRLNHNLNTTTDVVAYLTFKENHSKIENEAFAYGLNQYAVEQMFADCLENIMVAPQYNAVRFDFVLSLIPQDARELYNYYINETINSLLVNGQFTVANRYNDIIIAEDKYNDIAYFKRLYIKRKTLNPFVFVDNCDLLYEDPDFSAAIDAYAEKHAREQNVYIELVNQYHILNKWWKVLKTHLLKCGKLSKNGVNINVYESVSGLVSRLKKSDINQQIYTAARFIELSDYFEMDHSYFNEFSIFEKELEYFNELLSKLSNVNWNGLNFLHAFFPGDSIHDLIDWGIPYSSANVDEFFSLVCEVAKGEKFCLSYMDDVVRRLVGNLVHGVDYSIDKFLENIKSKLSKESIDKYLNDEQIKFSRNIKDLPVFVDFKQFDITIDHSICGAAFHECANLTNIIFPNSVTNIGNEAFSGCKALSKLTIGRGIKTIGKDAFK